MTGNLYAHKIRIFDYAHFTEHLDDELCENAERLPSENGLTREILMERGNGLGLVHILSLVAPCNSSEQSSNLTRRVAVSEG
jgi:hypothetical protein